MACYGFCKDYIIHLATLHMPTKLVSNCLLYMEKGIPIQGIKVKYIILTLKPNIPSILQIKPIGGDMEDQNKKPYKQDSTCTHNKKSQI